MVRKGYIRFIRENEPEKYEIYKEKKKLGMRRMREERAKRREQRPLTREELAIYEAQKERNRVRSRAHYYKKKAEMQKRTKSFSSDSSSTVTKKRPKDMTLEERKQYNAMMRQKHRASLSYQKKTAIKAKNRRRYAEKKKMRLIQLEEEQQKKDKHKQRKIPQSQITIKEESDPKPQETVLTSKEYSPTPLNLLNIRTLEATAATTSPKKQRPRKNPSQTARKNPSQTARKNPSQTARKILSQTARKNPSHTAVPDIEDVLGMEVLDKNTHLRKEVPCVDSTQDVIQLFYLQDDISRLLPHPRYVSKHGAARIMLMTIQDAFVKFRESNPSVQIGLTVFRQQRPKNVRLLWSIPVESCLCVYCTNVRLKINALNKVPGMSFKLPSEGKLLNFLNCPVSSKWNAIECIDGKCEICSNRMRPFTLYCRDIFFAKDLSWMRWTKNDSGKMEPQSKTGSVQDLLSELKKDLTEPMPGVSFSQHLFTAYWQLCQYEINRRNPADGEIVMVQDFDASRKTVFAEEMKCALSGSGQITVHPMVCFYRKGKGTICHSILVLSDDLSHDHAAVHAFTLAALDALKDVGSFHKLTLWADSAASQYQGEGTFVRTTHFPDLEVQTCYFGAEHCKGEADEEINVLSHTLRKAASGGCSFSSAEEVCSYMSKHHHLSSPFKKRQYVLCNDIQRNRPGADGHTVPGPTGYHQLQRLGPYSFIARRLACFCSTCSENNIEACMNRSHVGDYEMHELKPRTSDKSPSVKIGDYLHISFEMNKQQKKFYGLVMQAPNSTPDTLNIKFFQKAPDNSHMIGDPPQEDQLSEEPPDNFTLKIIRPDSVPLHMGHHLFS